MLKVSIITVVLNSEKTISDTIISIINQTYPEIEYIVVDGCSTDATLEILKMYENNIDLLISENDEGLYDAMNKGIKLATGDIIALLNSDDIYYDNNVIEKVVETFRNNQGLDIVYGDLIYVKESEINKIVRKWTSIPYSELFFNTGNVPPHPTLFIRKKVYDQISLFNLDFKLAADYEFMFRLFKKNSFSSIYLPEIFVRMRLGGVTSNSWKNRIKQNIEILRAWKLNGLRPPLYFLPLRIINKVSQFFI